MSGKPRRDETDDDLIRMQREDMKDWTIPLAAKVVNTGRSRPRSVMEAALASTFSAQEGKDAREDDLLNTGKLATAAVLSDIVEKEVSRDVVVIHQPCFVPTEGFPKAVKRNMEHQVAPATSRKSIFAQQMSKKKKSGLKWQHGDETMDVDGPKSSSQKSKLKHVLGNESAIVEGSGLHAKTEAQRIHEENLKKLTEMGQAKILAEQQELMQRLDPNLLQFLRGKRKAGVNKKSDCAEMQVKPKRVTWQEPLNSAASQEEMEEDTELPIPVSEAKKWPHMDVVEMDKLKYLTDLPKPNPIDLGTCYPARFDFKGDLLPYDADISVTSALYNHGLEPGRPGYTLDELFEFLRSPVLQQRVLALQTLANILKKVKEGCFDGFMNQPLLQSFLDSGLLLLLRFALDDKNEAVLNATLEALYHLVCSYPDECCLDLTLGWYRGQQQPSLLTRVETEPETKKNFQAEHQELKDYELVHLDVILALIRMDTLPRLRYILEVLKPPPKAVISILGLLIRICRHSLDSAAAVLNCPSLIYTIVENFLPQDWTSLFSGEKPSERSSVYGVPLQQALKLLRILASQGRYMAVELVKKYHIMERVLSFASVDPGETNLPLQEALLLSLESYYTWRTLLGYGLTYEYYIDFYPTLMRLLLFYQGKVSVNENVGDNHYTYDHGAAILNVLEAVVECTESPKQWSQVSGLLPPIEICVTKWMCELGRLQESDFSALKLVASAINFVTAFYKKALTQTSCNVVEVLQQLEKVWLGCGKPFSSTQVLQNLVNKLGAHSVLLSSENLGTLRDPANLPSLGSVTWGQKRVTPILQPTTPFHFLLSLGNLLCTMSEIHKGLSAEISQVTLGIPALVDYLEKVSQSNCYLLNHWFLQFEVYFLGFLLKLSSFKIPENPALYHAVGLLLLNHVPANNENLIRDILTAIVFSPHFLVKSENLSSALSSLDLHEQTTISSVTRVSGTANKSTLLGLAYHRLPDIASLYVNVLCGSQMTSTQTHSSKITSLTAKHSGQAALPVDWPFLPIVQLYNMASDKKKEIKSDLSGEEELNAIRRCLQWIFLLENMRPNVLHRMSKTCKFCRLTWVFLAKNDLFLDPTIHSNLHAILRQMLKTGDELDFNEDVPGINSWRDWYLQLLEQFEGVSYGDPLFALFVLLPLQQKHDSRFKNMVWGECSGVLRMLRTPIKEILVPMSTFLQPAEKDESLITSYFQALISGKIREEWSPVLYCIAVHHVREYILEKCNVQAAEKMKTLLRQLRNEEMKMRLQKELL